MKFAIFGTSCVVLIVGFVLAGTYYKKQEAAKLGFLASENAETFVRPHSPTLGTDDAKVYLVEFLDPACETCAVFSGLVKQMMEANPGKIKLVIRYAPFHRGSHDVVKLLEASKKQGKYWETLDILFRAQAHWTHHHQVDLSKVWQFLSMAELDVDQIKRDMQDPELDRRIAQDLADAKALNVRKTPGFFVNGKPLDTFGYRQLEQLIKSEIQASHPE